MKGNEMDKAFTKTSKNIDRYKWDELDSKCTHKRLPLSALNIGAYQRGEASARITTSKAAHYRQAAAGAVVVGERKDGTYWLVDGLQRKLAAEKRGDITHLNCMVFSSNGEQHEAEIFLLCNRGRVAVSALHKYHASVRAGFEPESTINTWLNLNGYSVGDNKNRKEIKCVTRFVDSWKYDEENAKKALVICDEICDGFINGFVFEGIWVLLRKGVDVSLYKDKLIRLGGRDAILNKINTTAILCGKSKTWSTCAAGVLSLINKGKQNKISIDI
jgi:hypothetical protein